MYMSDQQKNASLTNRINAWLDAELESPALRWVADKVSFHYATQAVVAGAGVALIAETEWYYFGGMLVAGATYSAIDNAIRTYATSSYISDQEDITD